MLYSVQVMGNMSSTLGVVFTVQYIAKAFVCVLYCSAVVVMELFLYPICTGHHFESGPSLHKKYYRTSCKVGKLL